MQSAIDFCWFVACVSGGYAFILWFADLNLFALLVRRA